MAPRESRHDGVHAIWQDFAEQRYVDAIASYERARDDRRDAERVEAEAASDVRRWRSIVGALRAAQQTVAEVSERAPVV
jgi:hypothetical protein